MTKEYSVLMSVYAKENPAYLHDSMVSMRRQTLPFSDFVLVCDGPLTPELEKEIDWAGKAFKDRFQCVRLTENAGLGNALAAGISYCRCPVIARMDSDDLSRPDRCRLQMEAMEKGGYDIVGGALLEFDETPGDTGTLRISPETPEEILTFAKKRNPFNHPCVMYRKEAVLEAGSYQDFPGFEDYYLWVRMLKNGARGYNLPQVLLDMRVGNGMHKRRGGAAYVASVLRFQRYLRKEKFIGTAEYLKNCLVRTAVGMFPGSLRKKFYHLFLRRKAYGKFE